MKLRMIFTHEFAYLAGRTSTRLYAVVLLAFTFTINGLTTPGDGVYENNTFHITATTVIGGLLWLVMGAAIAGQAAARDVQTGMFPLSYTTPVSKLHYLGGRFLAAFSINALLALLLPLGTLLSFYLPGLNAGELLHFRPWAYGSVYLLIALPNVCIATALQFAFAAMRRNVMASYMASLLLAIIAQVVAIAIAKLFSNWDLVKLLDPVGVSGIVGNELQTWAATEKNTRLVGVEGMFLWNRLLWLSIAAVASYLTYHRFHFAHPEATKSRGRIKKQQNTPILPPVAPITNSATTIKVPQGRGKANRLRQVTSIAWVSIIQIARNPAGILPVAAIALASVVFASRIMTQFGIPLLPTTQQVIGYLTAPVGAINTAWGIMPLLILYFAGELVWRERDARISDIADATPVSDWVLFSGKYLGLASIIALWMLILMAAGIGMQLNMGYHQLEPGLYLQVLFGFQLADYLLFGLLAIAMHVVTQQKLTGHHLLFLVFLFIALPGAIGVEHPMLIFGKDPGWTYSDMRGFGHVLGTWLWFKTYWLAWAVLLAVAASLLWPRGKETGWKYRLWIAQRRFSNNTVWVAAIGAVLLFVTGSFIFYNTNVLNDFQTSADINSLKAQYEKRYGKYRNILQPQQTATKLHVEIYPKLQQVAIRGVYTLVNKHVVTIDSIHVAGVPGIALNHLVFNRHATKVHTDEPLGYHIFSLQQPLLPGDSLQLQFEVHYRQEGFRHTTAPTLVLENGTSFSNYDLLPSIGYQHQRELKDEVLRKKHQMAARPGIPSLYDKEARKRPFIADQSSFEAIIGTKNNEIAVAPGVLQKTWTSGNRHYFHYKTDAPIGGEYLILSAGYRVQESRWKDVAIRVYYHPGHAQNVGRMLQSVKASLAYFTSQFGPYPYKHFTLAERPGPGGGASADASMVNYGEQYALLQPDISSNGFDLPNYILAHEVAHQWWGLARLTPANVAGAGVLIEGLAVYSGMQVLEHTHGAAHLRRYIAYLHSDYAMPRSLATPTLLEANEPFLYYRKGGLALYALSKYVGKEKVNGALRSLLQKKGSGTLPLPTTLDLYHELKTITPDSLHYLLYDLFEANTYWRLKTKQLTATQIKGGRWEVTLQLQAQKLVVDPTGAEKEAPMNDLLEIGLYEEGKNLDEPLYLKLHRIRNGEQTIKLTVPRKPALGGIDPNFLLIDLRQDDNLVQVKGT